MRIETEVEQLGFRVVDDPAHSVGEVGVDKYLGIGRGDFADAGEVELVGGIFLHPAALLWELFLLQFWYLLCLF